MNSKFPLLKLRAEFCGKILLYFITELAGRPGSERKLKIKKEKVKN